MTLDWQACSRARLTRDPRFDGKFFIGVLSSGVYCRSICPARTSMESNCRYYLTAASASEAGFRPCLRCRPECSPGTPAWLGTSTTVSRALRLISEGALEKDGVEALAEHLGVGPRHLRRLFLQHLGATPSAVAHTRRLHSAKKLIDETKLPMSYIAQAAGFGCVRRFNDAIYKTYHRTPTQIRRLVRQTLHLPENQYCIRLCYRPPYDWNEMLAFLKVRATPGVEVVDAGSYSRTISLHGNRGYFKVSFNPGTQSLAVLIQFDDPYPLLFIIERIRSMFDLDADWQAIATTLQSDRVLKNRIKASPGLRVPGCWNGFELATRAILGQQITVNAASVLAGRIVEKFGQKFAVSDNLTHLFPTASILADARLESVGLPKARAETVRRLASAVRDGKICFEMIVNTEEFLARLRQIPGIGRCTAQYIAMRALRDPDAFPIGDVALLRSMGLESFTELERSSESWRPWRAYAAMYLWLGAQNRSARTELASNVDRTTRT